MAANSSIRVDRHGRVRMQTRWIWGWIGGLIAFAAVETLAITLLDEHNPARPWFGLGFGVALLVYFGFLVRFALHRVRWYLAELRKRDVRPGQPAPWGSGPPPVR